MDSLVFYLIWAVVVFLVLRFGRDAHAMSVQQGQQVMPKQGSGRNPKQLGWIAPKTSIDPVCGNSVQTSYAKSSVDDGAGSDLLFPENAMYETCRAAFSDQPCALTHDRCPSR